MTENLADTPDIEPAQRLKRLQMILDVSRQVASMETLDAVLDTLVSVAVS